MCAQCEERAAGILSDPGRAERFLRNFTNDALDVGLASTQAAVAAAADRKMGAHLGSIALYAVMASLSEQLKATFGPKTAEIADRLRDEVKKRQVVIADVESTDLRAFRVVQPKGTN
jgi:hypothetical protein